MLNLNSIEFEKKSVFFINSILIIIMIVFFLFKIDTMYFFYFNIIITFILSYLFFKKSKNLSKAIILTNLFIFFYFLYPYIASFLFELLGEESYIFILFYNIVIAYIFLQFSGEIDNIKENITKINIKLIGIICLIGILFGLLFYFTKEPIPINSIFNPNNSFFWFKLIGFTLILAISEQMIFSGFLYNTYKNLTNRKEAYFQVCTLFVLFHLLRFENLILTYFNNFQSNYILLLIMYYILLFIFMLTALYFYNLKTKKYSGNILYPIILHFITDFVLIYIIISFGY